jgi:prolycopene isomerase
MVERVDAVVIGAGLGGLAAAVTLAQQGRHPVVLEQGSVPGGYATAFQRGPYRFDAALHALNGLAPGGGVDHLYRELGIWDLLRLHRLDPLYEVRANGRSLVAHADPFRYEAELAHLFPDAIDGIRAYLDEAFAVYRESRRLQVDSTAAGGFPGLEDFLRRYPTLARASGETWGQLLDRHVKHPQARGALAALWGYAGLPPSQLAATVGATMTSSYHHHGGWYPEGGAQAISGALVQALHAHGGEIRYGHLVTDLQVEHDRVVGVRTEHGRHLAADLVVSNASAPETMLAMVGRQHLPAEYTGQVKRRPGYTTFSVFLGLDRDLPAEQGLPHELFLAPPGEPEEGWRAGTDGDWGRTGISVTDYTRVDPGCAPPGHAVLVLTTVAAWEHEDTWGSGGDLAAYQENPRYQAIKQHVSDVLLSRTADAIPGLLEAVQHREASTPLTNYRYTRNPAGAIEGYENTPDNTGPGWLPPRTPLRNLYLAGAWTSTGGMNAVMGAGRTAALKAVSDANAPVPAR